MCSTTIVNGPNRGNIFWTNMKYHFTNLLVKTLFNLEQKTDADGASDPKHMVRKSSSSPSLIPTSVGGLQVSISCLYQKQLSCVINTIIIRDLMVLRLKLKRFSKIQPNLTYEDVRHSVTSIFVQRTYLVGQAACWDRSSD